ncbi:MAG TPA: DUF3943 domain-containing protein [Gemmatimonadales bacterium]|nr:DUF3943 domain-containing protein [Gemmatimonadales bacterium]
MSLCLSLRAPTAASQAPAELTPAPAPKFWQAAGGVLLSNWIPWAYNWYVQRWPWANVGVGTWKHNLRQGFVWDNDCFLDNQLAHPYHGSMYHNAARASGYGFWSSLPFVAAGSAGWELFGENIQASLNDLITTTVGGMALGEVTYRLSGLFTSRRGGARPGVGRGVGAFVASPFAATYDLLGGNAGDHRPAGSTPLRFALGRQSRQPFVELAVQYGNPFAASFARPYDAFEFRMRVSPASDTIVNYVGISGLLARRQLSESSGDQLFLGVYQHFDYDHTPHIKLSGHSVSAALLYQKSLGARNRLSLGAHAEGLLFGGISSDYGYYWRRDFDLGPGAGARLTASFSRDELTWLRLESRVLWLHSLHGTESSHLTSSVRLAATIPVAGGVGVGGDLAFTTRHSRYRDFAPVTKQVPQLSAFVMVAH